MSASKVEASAAAAANSKRPRSDDEEEEEDRPTPTPITAEGEMPQKKFYRSRAHCNPLSHNDAFDYPVRPSAFDWTAEHYPDHPRLANSKSDGTDDARSIAATIAPDVLDVGCGFGGLTLALSTLLPQHTILGLEIRSKVTEYVRLRIAALRREHSASGTGQYRNCSVLRTNAMKYLPNMFAKSSLHKLFFCFPDPHFKRKNHPRRIVSERLLSEYAYLLKPGVGRLYCITDVEELHLWHVEKCRSHPLFRELTQEEMEEDKCVEAMVNETEEGKKVERAGAAKYYAVYERIDEKEEEAAAVGGSDSSTVVSAENFWDEGGFGVRSLLRDDGDGGK